MQEFARLDKAGLRAACERVAGALPKVSGEARGVAELCELMASDEKTEDGPKQGEMLGKYRLVERLGSGAFGAVWRAWDTELGRYVALKLLHQAGVLGGGILGSVGVSAAAGLRRIMTEAQAAASLDHPNVVKIHAAGKLPDGRAFIDAQLVGDAAPTREDAHSVAVGMSLEQMYASGAAGGQARSPRWAARIIEQVARGVASAHARGVVHRDIKPANIIVTPSGKPMLADFGLSALTALPTGAPVGAAAGGNPGATGSMHTGRITGTPAFMAPEQARGERATPASDIYSLGATLRYLLTGELPVKPTGRHSTEARADVLEQLRRGELGGLELLRLKGQHARLPLTLVRICDRATAAKVEDRYPSAFAMAEDLAAWLDRRPTTAGREAVSLRALLWARRNAAVVLIAAGAMLVFGVMIQQHVVRLSQERDRAVRAEGEARMRQGQAEDAARVMKLAEKEALAKKNEAERSARIALGISAFMSGTLMAAQADEGRRTITMYDAVTRAADSVSTTPGILGGDPLVEAGVRYSIGRVLGTMGDFKKAESHFRSAVEIRAKELGPDHPDTLEAEFGLSEMLSFAERNPEASAIAEPLLVRVKRVLGDEAILTLSVKDVLGQTRLSLGDAAGAEAMMREALETRLRQTPVDESRVAMGYSMLGTLAKALSKREEAISHMKKCLEIRERILGRDALDTMGTVNDLGSVYAELGDVAQAEPLQREAYAWMREHLGPTHVNTINSGYNVAWMLLTKKKNPAESLAIAAPIAKAAEEALGKDNVVTMRTRLLVARGYAGTGACDKAEPLVTELMTQAERAGREGLSFRILGSRVMADCCKARGDTKGEAEWRARAAALLEESKADPVRGR
jgi:serine/threonine protein kinase